MEPSVPSLADKHLLSYLFRSKSWSIVKRGGGQTFCPRAYFRCTTPTIPEVERSDLTSENSVKAKFAEFLFHALG